MTKRKTRNVSRSRPKRKAKPEVGEALADLALALKCHRLRFLLVTKPSVKLHEWTLSEREEQDLPSAGEAADAIKGQRSGLEHEDPLDRYERSIENWIRGYVDGLEVGEVQYRNPWLSPTPKGASRLTDTARAIRDAAQAVKVADRNAEVGELADEAFAHAFHRKNAKSWTHDRPVSWSYVRRLRKLERRIDGALRKGQPASGVRDSDRKRRSGEAPADRSPDTDGSDKTEEAGPVRKPEPLGKLPKLGPHDRQAYQLSLLHGKTQESIAEILNKEHGTMYGQGQVSRMIRRAKVHASASGLDQLVPPSAKPPIAIDASRLDIGRRTDGRRSGRGG